MVDCFTDVHLARRLERAERDANARFVDVRARVHPGVGAAWVDVNGTYAMFDGVDSPCTQTFGFGLFAPPSESNLQAIERFFSEREAPVFHEVCPLADPAHLALLSDRGYRPFELSTVLYQPLDADARRYANDGSLVVRVARSDVDRAIWAQTLACGWSDQAGAADAIEPLAHVSAERADAHLFLVESDGRAIAAGSLSLAGGVALLAGASTIPSARRRGAQSALLAARQAHAAQHACDVAMVVAAPGSGSQRNAERNGFRIAYTRTKWRRFP
jgi:hypothetical protein